MNTPDETPTETAQPQFKPNRKLRRALAAKVRQYARQELKRLHRDLKMMRHEDGKPTWRPEKIDDGREGGDGA